MADFKVWMFMTLRILTVTNSTGEGSCTPSESLGLLQEIGVESSFRYRIEMEE